MKFIANQSDLLKTLTLTGKAIGTSIVIPILECCLINIKDNKLEATGSNMEVFITNTLEVKADGEACIAVPHNKLTSLVKSLPDGIPITFELVEFTIDVTRVFEGKVINEKEKKQRLDIKAGSGEYVLPAENGEDFPVLENKDGIEIKLESQLFLECVNKTLFAVGSDKLKPAMAGVLLEVANKMATLTGTNAHILGTFNMGVSSDKQATCVIPARILGVLKDMPVGNDVKVTISDRNIVFEVAENITLKSVLIGEKFVDYKGFIPKNNDKTLTIGREDLKNALRRAVLFSNSVTNIIKLNLGTELTITSENNDYGEKANESLQGDFEGDELTIGLNGKMLMECISRYKSENLKIEFSTYTRPAVIKDTTSDYKQDLMMIMPMVG